MGGKRRNLDVLPRRLRARWHFRLYVPGMKGEYIRCHIHETRGKMLDYLEDVNPRIGDCHALCSFPNYCGAHDPKCIGELNFYYPHIGPAVLSHELMHATINVFSRYGPRMIVPPKSYNQRARRRGHSVWSDRHEAAAEIIEGLTQQFRNNCVRRKLRGG